MRQVFDVPERGDVISLILPSKGRPGPAGRRAAVVISPQSYNARVGLAVVCPLSSRVSGYPFEVAVPSGLPVSGVILADQAVSVDWRALRSERICPLPAAALEEIAGKLRALLA